MVRVKAWGWGLRYLGTCTFIAPHVPTCTCMYMHTMCVQTRPPSSRVASTVLERKAVKSIRSADKQLSHARHLLHGQHGDSSTLIAACADGKTMVGTWFCNLRCVLQICIPPLYIWTAQCTTDRVFLANKKFVCSFFALFNFCRPSLSHILSVENTCISCV